MRTLLTAGGRGSLRKTLLALPLAVVILLALTSLVAHADAVPTRDLLYVCNGHNITVLNATDLTVADTISFDSATHPSYIALSPNGTLAYVVSIADDRLLVVDTAQRSVVRTVTLAAPAGKPRASSSAIAVSADGSRIFVSDYQAGLVRIINASTLEVTAAVPVGVAPIGLDVTRDGRFVYVACSGSGTIAAIDAASGAVIGVIAGGNGTFDVKLSPDGSRLYASNWYGGNVVIADAYNGSVLDSVQVTGWVGEGQGGINNMRLSPDGGRLYLSDAHDNTIVIIGTSQRSIVRSVPVGSYPREIALSTNGSRLFAGQVGAGSIAALALPDGVITANTSTPATPAGIAYFSALKLPTPTPVPNDTANATPTPAPRPSFLPTTTPTPAPTPTPTPVPIPGPVYGFPPGTVSQATPTPRPTPALAPGTTPTLRPYFLGWDVPKINVSQEDMIVLILGGITAFLAVISIVGFITVRKKMRPPEK